ncbi:putative disease resistance protein RGA3 [Zea mays]|uniref:Disease resistance protein RGA3 n=1 Tax=Zea mays TaxID=4577 RepID=A0A804Q1G5_MAIZE|nr:putative disease resistance protein RGA3 [Zea mays]|eukprot:XP_020395193.1 putative disease resistance protein RGA3 [Zea mays]
MPIGEVVLSAFTQALFEKVLAATIGELKLPPDVTEELQSLSSILSTIQFHVEDAEERQLKDKAARSWLAKLKDVADEMDDLLDEYAAETLRSKLEGPSNHDHLKKVRSCFCCFWLNKCFFNHKIAQHIRKIEGKLDRLIKERQIIGPNMNSGTDRQEIKERPKTSSLIDDSSVFGREKDKETIVKMLLAPNNNSGHANLSIIPIVGMGGLGKTTLTQLIYNDERVKEHFQLRVWLCVSENFDEMKLTKETIESVASGFSSATTNMNLLQEDLSKKLQGKRFLLVLDDVWNEDPEKWDRYRCALLSGGKGSRIIITTRNKNVGILMGGMTPYHLKQLSNDDCWQLFKKHAFVDGDSSSHPELEIIGKDIVKKLKGLPLAAKAVSSLLCTRDAEEDWKNILKSEIWELPSDKNNILPALRLSYSHLPATLKRCFAFCSVFPKDYVFEKTRLVQIWMALGFIQPQGRRKMEEIGSGYFDELQSRSFFQHHKSGYVMHDAMHDLAQSVSINECLRLDEGLRLHDPPHSSSPATARNARHLSFSCDNRSWTQFEAFLGFKRARTLLLLNGYKSITNSIPSDLFIKLKYLHVLDLNRRDITELPDSIGNLKLLRYLNLSGTGIEMLPSSIGRLFSLQTLKLQNCHSLDYLPKTITNLINLRWLEARTELINGIAGIGNLTCLQQLEEFVVRKDKGYKISELKAINGITGQICIKNLESVASVEEADEALLTKKTNINNLHLIWSESRRLTSKTADKDMKILEHLQPHHELSELSVKAFAGIYFPNWLSKLTQLQTIHLSDCTNCSVLPALGVLPLLKFLDFGGFHAIVHINQEFSGTSEVKRFPSLKELVFEDMSNLKGWTSVQDGQLLPLLTELAVIDCPLLEEFPSFPSSVVKLKISETGFAILPEIYTPSSQVSSSLVCLEIHQCPNLTSLERGLLCQKLSMLQQLTITGCPELTHLPVEGFRALTALKSIHIYDCPKLEPSQQHSLLPSMLEDLRISSCSNLINPLLREIDGIFSMTNLAITDCASLRYFPVKLPATLKKLEIFHCSNLRCLPPGIEATSCLAAMTILKCPLIPSLPEQGLPQSLKELYIKECPLLTKSCKENDGEDWPKIAHVPTIEIEDDSTMTDWSIRRSFYTHHSDTGDHH